VQLQESAAELEWGVLASDDAGGHEAGVCRMNGARPLNGRGSGAAAAAAAGERGGSFDGNEAGSKLVDLSERVVSVHNALHDGALDALSGGGGALPAGGSDGDWEWDDAASIVSGASHTSYASCNSCSSASTAYSLSREPLMAAKCRRQRGPLTMPVKFAWGGRRLGAELRLRREFGKTPVAELVRLLVEQGSALLDERLAPSALRIDAKLRRRDGGTRRVPITPRTASLRELRRTEALLITRWEDAGGGAAPVASPPAGIGGGAGATQLAAAAHPPAAHHPGRSAEHGSQNTLALPKPLPDDPPAARYAPPGTAGWAKNFSDFD